MAEKKSDDQIQKVLMDTKETLAEAEKELIRAKKNKEITEDDQLMKIITTNYEVAKNNLATVKQLAKADK
ncbi:hypothetical protein [Limosilactobacillus kribbianus]|uniref:hypothetical protein n=1 Tax=Limosilactobacillus kribbianus TaxID=2982695 RepID=UPI002264139E|nr:hypothetical protein [Limosilactobacillus kribbianus]